jgi:transcriptional regulator with XRE-family HTH domain
MSMTASKLRGIRAKYGLTTKELGIKSGVGQAQISAIENERRSPTIRTLEKISNCLGILLSELV